MEDDVADSPVSLDGEGNDDDRSEDEPMGGESGGAGSAGGGGKTKTPARRGKARLNYLASHKVIEKKRRDRINNALATLGQIVPDCAQLASKKLDKALTLENTIHYIERIHSGAMPGLSKPRGAAVKQVLENVSRWVSDNWRSYSSTEEFAHILQRNLMSLINEEAGTAAKAIKRENDGSQMPAPSVLLGTAVLPQMQLGGGASHYDGRPPQLLPVVPPSQSGLNTAAALFPAQLRPPSTEAVENQIMWSQQQQQQQHQQQQQQQLILQHNLIHQQNAAAAVAAGYTPFLGTSSAVPITMAHPYMTSVSAPGSAGPHTVDGSLYNQQALAAAAAVAAQHSPAITANAGTAPASSGVDVWQSPSAAAAQKQPQSSGGGGGRPQVTFSSTVTVSSGDEKRLARRPDHIMLGPSIQASAVATPSGFSTVSTPRGANTPGADDILDMQSPHVTKPFPFSGSNSTPNRAANYRQKQAPTMLNLEQGDSLQLPPNFNAASTAPITPQRQSLANSLLQLSGQTQFSGAAAAAGVSRQEDTEALLSPVATTVDDALRTLPSDPQLLMSARSFREQLMQQFSPPLQDPLQPPGLQLSLGNSAAGGNGGVEAETPAGMPMLTKDKRSLPLARHLDPGNGDDADWAIRHAQAAAQSSAAGAGQQQDEDSQPSSQETVGTPRQAEPAKSLLLLARQADLTGSKTSNT
eukprot:scpid76350/ scgid33282/ Hairy and enhancer of split-related protein HELT; HES/HEY-like transcription factor; Protein Hes-like; Protein megane